MPCSMRLALSRSMASGAIIGRSAQEKRFFLSMRAALFASAVSRAIPDQIRMRGAEVIRSSVRQFGQTAISVENADRLHAVFPGADDIMAPVTDHDGLRGIDLGGGERVGQKIRLVRARAVEF